MWWLTLSPDSSLLPNFYLLFSITSLAQSCIFLAETIINTLIAMSYIMEVSHSYGEGKMKWYFTFNQWNGKGACLKMAKSQCLWCLSIWLWCYSLLFLFAKPRQNGTTNVCISACLWKCDLEKVDWVLCSGSSWQELDSAGPISTVHLPNMLSRD